MKPITFAGNETEDQVLANFILATRNAEMDKMKFFESMQLAHDLMKRYYENEEIDQSLPDEDEREE